MIKKEPSILYTELKQTLFRPSYDKPLGTMPVKINTHFYRHFLQWLMLLLRQNLADLY